MSIVEFNSFVQKLSAYLNQQISMRIVRSNTDIFSSSNLNHFPAILIKHK